MALTDCPECWSTPCDCGHEYKNWSIKRLIEMRDMFQRLIDEKSKEEKFINCSCGSPCKSKIRQPSLPCFGCDKAFD